MKSVRLPFLLLLGSLLLSACGEASSEVSSSAAETTSSATATSQETTSSTATASQETTSKEATSSSSFVPSSSQSKDDYGWKVDFSEYGKDFATTLGGLITGKTTSYKNCLSVGAKAMAFPSESSSKFIPFYHAPEASQVASTGECNREHTWPDSRGGGLIETDPLVIRPTLTKDNSDRGNDFYGIGSSQWDPASCGYEGARGESARVILYAATRYAGKGLSLSNNPSDSAGKHTMGTLKTLLEWNNKYQPTDFERTVNERYAKMGYARNPFVDCPDFANYIYDSNGYRTTPYQGGETPVSSSQTPASSSQTPSSTSSYSPASSQETPVTGGWNLVKSVSELEEGSKIVFAYAEGDVVAGTIGSSVAYLSSETATFSSDKAQIAVLPESACVFTVGKSGSSYTFATGVGLLGATDVKKLAFGDGTTEWSVSINNGIAEVKNADNKKGTLQYNTSAPRFTTYKSGQKSIQIYMNS